MKLLVLVITPDYLDDIQGSAVLVGGHLRSFKDTSAAYIRRTSVNVENEIEGSRYADFWREETVNFGMDGRRIQAAFCCSLHVNIHPDMSHGSGICRYGFCDLINQPASGSRMNIEQKRKLGKRGALLFLPSLGYFLSFHLLNNACSARRRSIKPLRPFALAVFRPASIWV